MSYKNRTSRVRTLVAFAAIVCAACALGASCGTKADTPPDSSSPKSEVDAVPADANVDAAADDANRAATDRANETPFERKAKGSYPPFTDDEIAAAKSVIERYFEALNAGDADAVNSLVTPIHRGAEVSQTVRLTLNSIDYDASDWVRETYMLHGSGSENGALAENVIGFYSNFDVDTSNDPIDSGAWEDGTRDGWQFSLVRENKNAPWLIDDQGY